MPYLYLPYAPTDPPFEANNPSNFERFWYVVSGGNLRGGFFAFGPGELPARLAFYWGHLLDNLHWGLLVAAAVGFVVLFLWDRPAAGLLGFLFFGWVFYSIENDIPDVEVYFVPTYMVLALAAAAVRAMLRRRRTHEQIPANSRRVSWSGLCCVVLFRCGVRTPT